MKNYFEEQDLIKLFDEKKFDSNELILYEEILYLFDNEDFETQTPSQW